MNKLTAYLEQYALASLEKQEKFACLLGEYTADINYDTGLARFTGGFEFPFQVLGTESDNTLSWLWAWADEQAEIPAGLLKSSLQMKAWGENNGIREFTMSSVDLNQADGRVLSLISSGVCEAGCFFREDYDGGALFLLLFGSEIDLQPSLAAADLIRQFSDLIALNDLNHQNTLLSYLRRKHIPIAEQGAVIEFDLESGERMSMEFGPAKDLIKINGKELPVD